MAKSLSLAQAQSIPIYVVGVGTTAGGIIPDPKRDATQAAIRSVLDRNSLATIATAGGGRYFELDREEDRDIANTIIDLTRRRSGGRGVEQAFEDRYREFLMAAAGLVVSECCSSATSRRWPSSWRPVPPCLILIARLV